MSINITLKKSIKENKIRNYVLFSDENFKIKGIKDLSLSKYSQIINQTINNNKLKDKDFLSFNLNPSQKIILLRIKEINTPSKIERVGADFYDYIKSNSIFNLTFFDKNIIEFNTKNKNFLMILSMVFN